MKKLLYKEMRLSANPLSYWFITFSAMTMIPRYPILVGSFLSVWVYFIPISRFGNAMILPTRSCCQSGNRMW